ncbi:MAG: replication-associated recombination protein A [Candidatus Berkiellales bacterium]
MTAPLAARLRPTHLSEFVGQSHLVGNNSPLRLSIEQGKLHSMLLWGPPGTGKTTLAHLIATYCHADFVAMSAVLAGVKDIRDAIQHAAILKKEQQKSTILFIDEIHRFNKNQQDALLPAVEDGTVYFIGATTENPSFEVNNALLSRCRIYVLKPLTQTELTAILQRACENKSKGLGQQPLYFQDPDIEKIILSADGDARRLLNILEIISDRVAPLKLTTPIPSELIDQILQQDYRQFDKQGDIFYQQISALHKAVRGTSPDAALYWLCRMLDGGCDPLYIARRVVRMACEDIGNADPRALPLALAAWEAVERLGRPEGDLSLAQVVLYLASAPKSNKAYTAFNAAMKDVSEMPSYAVPLHLCNAPTRLLKQLGYGKDYRYDPDEPNGFAKGQTYFPDEIGEKRYYFPGNHGLEIKIAEKLKVLREDK